MLSFTYILLTFGLQVTNLKISYVETSEYNKKEVDSTDIESKLVVTSGEREEGRGNKGVGK